MNFVSFNFIVLCMITVCGYYILPVKYRWVFIMAANVVFYQSAGYRALGYIVLVAAVSWIGCMELTQMHQKEAEFLKVNKKNLSREEKKKVKHDNEKKRKKVLLLMILLIVGQLAVIKYNVFFVENWNAVFGSKVNGLHLDMPLGISFYTIFVLGYCIDVYRGQYIAEQNFFKHFCVVSFFPCVSQGPIERYDHLKEQIFAQSSFEYQKISFGLQRMIWGFFKKMVIADNVATAVNTVFYNEQGIYKGFYILVAAFLYAIQLYADFSGYIDIAAGISQMLGIELVENFETPYFSTNIAEFWRRWHISLGTWFKDYVFYSVLRSEWCQKLAKKTKCVSREFSSNLTTSIALLIIWSVIGFWHGSSWKYIAYGLYYGCIIIFSTWMKPVYQLVIAKLRINVSCFSWKLFQMIRTFSIVTFGYILFCAKSLGDFFRLVKLLFCQFNPWIFFNGGIFELGIDTSLALVLFVAVGILFFVDIFHEQKWKLREKIAMQNEIFRAILIIGLILVILIFGAYGSGYNASDFIYGQF